MDGAGFSERIVPQPIWCESDAWDEADIPPQQWLAPGYFMRGKVTLKIGTSGVSKSMLALAYAIALALNRPLQGMRPEGVFRSLVYNCEDDAPEQRRRLSAALTSVGKTPADVAGLIFRTGPSKLGALFGREADTGAIVPTSAMTELKRIVRENRIDAVFLDPLAELHGEEENSNEGMRAIAAEFRLVAAELHVAVIVVHHTRKGLPIPGDPEASRGASSLVGAARTVLTVVAMTEEEGAAFGLTGNAHKAMFRVDGGKANHAPLTECEWFERVAYELANGDRVAAVVPWSPPADTLTLDTRLAIEAAVATGSSVGPWSPKMSGDSRSIRQLLQQHGVVTSAGQKAALAQLLTAGFNIVEFRKAGGNRSTAQGLRSPEGKPSTASWIETDAES